MSETATCAKCMYTARFPYATGEMVKMFFDNHDCDSTKLQQAIERVRELHSEVDGKCVYCSSLLNSLKDYGSVHYPCATIKALNGETNG